MRKGLFILMLLVGCQAKDTSLLSSGAQRPAPEGLPRARPIDPGVETPGAPPKVTRGESAERTTAQDVLFPRNEAMRSKWAHKREEMLRVQQRKLDQFHIQKESAEGRTLPRMQLGEMNQNPPTLDP